MKRDEYQNRRIIDLFAAKLHNSPIYYIALYRGFNTEKQKGKMKKINVTVADITTLKVDAARVSSRDALWLSAAGARRAGGQEPLRPMVTIADARHAGAHMSKGQHYVAARHRARE